MPNTYTYPVQNIRDIRENYSRYFEFSRYDAAYDLYSDLYRYIESEKNTLFQKQPGLLREYEDMLAKAGWAIFDRLPSAQVFPFFEHHLQYFFDEPWEYRKEQVQRLCGTIPKIAERDEIKDRFRKAIESSNTTIGQDVLNINGSSMPPTISSWITDFRQSAQYQAMTDPLVLTQYLNTTPNIQNRSKEVRLQVEGLLRFYQYIITPSIDPAGTDDVYYYHDVYTGTIHLFRDGHDIDTGEPSPIVASMTPAEIAAEKKRIERDVQAMQNIDLEAVNKGDLTTLQTYADIISSPLEADQLPENPNNRRQSLQTVLQESTSASNTQSVVSNASSWENQPLRPNAAHHPSHRRANRLTAQHETHVAVENQKKTFPDIMSMPVRAHVRVAPEKRVSKTPRVTTPSPSVAPRPSAPTAVQPSQRAQVNTVSAPVTRIQTDQALRSTRMPRRQAAPRAVALRFDVVTLAQQVLSDYGLLLDSAETERRFISLISAYVKGEQEEKEILKSLVMPSNQGGVNLTAGIASSVLRTAMQLSEHPEQIRQRRNMKSNGGVSAFRPTLATAQEAIDRQKQLNAERQNQQSQSYDAGMSVDSPFEKSVASQQNPQTHHIEDIFANLDASNNHQTAAQQKTQAMLAQTQAPSRAQNTARSIMGPIDELKDFSLEEFRSYGIDPNVATNTIAEKIRILGQQSVAKRAEGIRAWQQSPVHRLYVDIGNASLQLGVSVDQYIAQHQADASMLTEQEFDAISALNRALRF